MNEKRFNLTNLLSFWTLFLFTFRLPEMMRFYMKIYGGMECEYR